MQFNKYIEILLKPLAKFCINRGLSHKSFIEASKIAFIRAAEEQLLQSKEKVALSRLSVMTGLNRRELKRLSELPEDPSENSSIAAKVIGQWEQDQDFLNKSGKPRVLSYKGQESEFTELVEKISSHVRAKAVLDELIRLDLVEQSASGLKLKGRLQTFAGNMASGFELIAKDLDSLLQSGGENLLHEYRDRANLHIRTEYDNIAEEDLAEIRSWILKEGKLLHRRAREFLSTFDRDVNPQRDQQSARNRVSFTAFSAISRFFD